LEKDLGTGQYNQANIIFASSSLTFLFFIVKPPYFFDLPFFPDGLSAFSHILLISAQQSGIKTL